jgi:hypothetical protein
MTNRASGVPVLKLVGHAALMAVHQFGGGLHVSMPAVPSQPVRDVAALVEIPQLFEVWYLGAAQLGRGGPNALHLLALARQAIRFEEVVADRLHGDTAPPCTESVDALKEQILRPRRQKHQQPLGRPRARR